MYNQDILCNRDTLYSQDTLHNQDTLYSQDTLHNQDTLYSQDTLHNQDTLYSQDTLHNQDTLYSQDTLHNQDTFITPCMQYFTKLILSLCPKVVHVWGSTLTWLSSLIPNVYCFHGCLSLICVQMAEPSWSAQLMKLTSVVLWS